MRKVLPSELTNTIEQFIVYVHRNEAHFHLHLCIMPMYLRITTFTKKPPPNDISPQYNVVAILILLWGSTHDSATAGALTDPQLPATPSNVCTNGAMLGGVGRVPPNKNPGYAGDRRCCHPCPHICPALPSTSDTEDEFYQNIAATSSSFPVENNSFSRATSMTSDLPADSSVWAK